VRNQYIIFMCDYINFIDWSLQCSSFFQLDSCSSRKWINFPFRNFPDFPRGFQQYDGKHTSTYSRNMHEQVQRQWKSACAAALNEWWIAVCALQRLRVSRAIGRARARFHTCSVLLVKRFLAVCLFDTLMVIWNWHLTF